MPPVSLPANADEPIFDFDLTSFIENVETIVASHQLGEPGHYRRWNTQNAGNSRDLGLNPYGCADAANILYTIGRFPRDVGERASWIATLQSLQAEDGLYHEATHHAIHCTAHCIAALELFDAGPLRPLKALEEWRDPANVAPPRFTVPVTRS